jgi:NADPH:quinone reductase-like Zn-dependent oxidoreductase
LKTEKIIAQAQGRMVLIQEQLGEPERDEVQVRACVSVVSPGTERAFIMNMENTGTGFPRTVGYSMAGIVEKTGAEVTGFQKGDRVAGIMLHQSVANVKARNLVPIPDGVSFEDAAFIRIGVIAMQGVRKARVELGEAVLVFGMGLIGQTAIQLAKASGAVFTAGVDKEHSKLALAVKLGAKLAINTADTGWLEQARGCFHGKAPQVVIESTGFPEPIALSCKAVRNFGRVVILGSTRGNAEIDFYSDVHKKGITVIGAHISTNPADHSYPAYWTFQDNAACFLDLLAQGTVKVGALVSQTESYRNFGDIYQNVLHGDSSYITSLIDWRQ